MGIFNKWLNSIKKGRQNKLAAEPMECVSGYGQTHEEENRETIKRALTIFVPEDQMDEIIEKIELGGSSLPANYFKFQFPIEDWDSLTPDRLEMAQCEWDCFMEVLTEEYYRFCSFLLSGNNKGDGYWGYLELRYEGGYASYGQLMHCERILSDLWETKRFQNAEEDRATMLSGARRVLEEANLGVRIKDILVQVVPM